LRGEVMVFHVPGSFADGYKTSTNDQATVRRNYQYQVDEDGDQILSNVEPQTRGLLFEGRTESINAATIFVNPNIVQPAVREQASLPVEQLPATFSRQQHSSGSHPLMSPTPPRPETIIGQDGDIGDLAAVVLHGSYGDEPGVPIWNNVNVEDDGSMAGVMINCDESSTNSFSMFREDPLTLANSATVYSAQSELPQQQFSLQSPSPTVQQPPTTAMVKIKSPPSGGELDQQWGSHSLQSGIQLKTVNSRMEPSSTGFDVSTTDYAGVLNFQVTFTRPPNSMKNKQWEYSNKLKKLYIDVDRWAQVEFNIGVGEPTQSQPPPSNLYVRCLPVYADAAASREPVLRCPNHASPEHPSNRELFLSEEALDINGGAPSSIRGLQHLVRCQSSDGTAYVTDAVSGRLSTLIAIGQLHRGSRVATRNIKFMCLGSDVGGMNRRPIRLIFTLEQLGGVLSSSGDEKLALVLGRRVMDVRVCSCPRRDLLQEEQRFLTQEEQARTIAARFADTTPMPPAANNNTTITIKVPSVPPGKKRKVEDSPPVILMPVHTDDFVKLNEIAESLWVCREPGNADQIRATRRRLLRKHNAEALRKAQEK